MQIIEKILGSTGITGSSSFLLLWCHHVPLAHLIIFQPPWPPVFLRYIKLFTFPGLWILFLSTQKVFPSDPQHTLLNIEVTFLARTTLTSTSGTSTLLFQPLSIPISCFLQNTSYLKLACFFIYYSSVCLPPHNVASLWSRPCLFWSRKYP